MDKYRLTRDVTSEECPWLGNREGDESRDGDLTVLRKGTIVFGFKGSTYGVIGDEGIAVSMDDDLLGSFVEVPENAVEPFRLCQIDECECGK